jgi:cell wall-associated NlpC family hydrolase
MPVEKSISESLEELRQCVGTPWVHQGRKPHVGFDCAGFGKHWLDLRGYKVIDRKDYGRDPDGSLYDEMCRVLGPPVALGSGAYSSARKGYMVMIQYSPNNPRHVGVIGEFQSEPYLIHADSHHKKVVEHPIDARWAKRIVGVWRVV